MADRLHIVKAGEWLTQIAQDYGFPSADEVYNYERNAALRDKRANPSEVYPGDEVWIPPCPYEVELELSAAGASSHEITALMPGLESIEMVLSEADGSPMKNKDYEFQIGAHMKAGKTDGSGMLKEEFDARLMRFGSYTLRIDGREFDIEIGHLDPIGTTEGLQARLANLGYDVGEVDGVIGEKTRRAVRYFQSDMDLYPDGIAGPKTRDKLEQEYAK